MKRNAKGKFRMYDQNLPDFDILNSFNEELIEIASPPIRVFVLNYEKTIEQLQGRSVLDELYGEANVIDEEALKRKYEEGFSEGDSHYEYVAEGEIFDPAVMVEGYYQEPTWTQELERIGITMPEELAITFNYQNMVSKLNNKQIKIGDLIQTFRGDLYRVGDAYVADETISWKYIHYHVICRKPQGIDRFILPPGALEIPQKPRGY